MGHFLWTVLLAAALSAVMAAMDRKTRRERVYRGVYVFGGFLVAIFGIGWSMYLINP
jgi:predicted PurR-regulated permease PerM